MPLRPLQRARWIVALIALASCKHGADGPSDGPPARLDAASAATQTGTVGTTLQAPVVVRVRDASGRDVLGATVTFAVTQGNGSVSPRLATTDNTGQARTTWTLGTVSGLNEITAAATGLSTSLKFSVAATAGEVASITVTPTSARILNSVDTTRINATSRDVYGNIASPPPTFVVRDPTLLSVSATGLVRALRRGGSSYVVVTAGTRSDSVLVTVLALGESICTAVATPLQLSVGQVVTDLSGDLCVRASTTTEEYTLVAYYNSAVSSATAQIETKPVGVTAPVSSSLSISASPNSAATTAIARDESFELALRQREATELANAAPAARSWFANRRSGVGPRPSFSVVAQAPEVGDLLAFNVNALEGCARADARTGRIVAITNKAIVVADTANPPGGFTDADYRSFGVTFDTLVHSVDAAAFGAPADFDENGGRSVLFFTRAVNALTPRGSGSVVLGFFYGRDILPKTTCAASNFTKMFYLLVPDPDGVASDARSIGVVKTVTNGTIAHEYQHLINASRRMYINNAVGTTEEVWLNEGLSHIAEELNYLASARLQTRANLDAAGVAPSIANGTFQTFQANNLSRFRRYLQTTETQSPTGSDPFDDDLPTRGGAWSFLRYVADHQPGINNDGDLWFKLVNSTNTGLANLTAALGANPRAMLRDWSLAILLDDTGLTLDPRFQHLSWNFRSAMPAGGFTYALASRALSDGATTTATIAGGGTSYQRFAVSAGQDALITITSTGQPVPSAIQLALVRIR
jgi:hypothetical protein